MNSAFYEIEENFTPICQIVLTLMRTRNLHKIYDLMMIADISVVNINYDNWNGGTYGYMIYLYLPVTKYSTLNTTDIDLMTKQIADIFNEANKTDNHSYFMVTISPVFSPVDVDWGIIGGANAKVSLRKNIENVKNIMISVATGKGLIQDYDKQYKQLQFQIIQDCKKLNIKYPNKHKDLWDWYNKWRIDLPTYQSRREYVNHLFSSICLYFEDVNIEDDMESIVILDDWEDIKRTHDKIKTSSIHAKDVEDFQQIGLLCRELIISLAQAIYNPQVHGNTSTDGTIIGKTDAKRMIENYLTVTLSGNTNKEIRNYVKDTNALAQCLTHQRNATKKDMLLTVSATLALVNIIGILEDKY